MPTIPTMATLDANNTLQCLRPRTLQQGCIQRQQLEQRKKKKQKQERFSPLRNLMVGSSIRLSKALYNSEKRRERRIGICYLNSGGRLMVARPKYFVEKTL